MPDTAPTHFALISSGSDGDIFPFFGLGKALVGRGYRVTLATNDRYQTLAVPPPARDLLAESVGGRDDGLAVIVFFGQPSGLTDDRPADAERAPLTAGTCGVGTLGAVD